MQNNERNVTSVTLSRVFLCSATDAVDGDDYEDYSEDYSCRNERDDDDDNDIIITQS